VFITSYLIYKNLLQVQKGLSSGKDTILPQADDRGFRIVRLEEVFIKVLPSSEQQSNIQEIGQV
jgi:hypothetical protein